MRNAFLARPLASKGLVWIQVSAQSAAVPQPRVAQFESLMSSPWIEVTARTAVWLAALLMLASSACGTPQKGGPRRMASDDDEDAGAPPAMSCSELKCN